MKNSPDPYFKSDSTIISSLKDDYYMVSIQLKIKSNKIFTSQYEKSCNSCVLPKVTWS